jgi:hypothetical protein
VMMMAMWAERPPSTCSTSTAAFCCHARKAPARRATSVRWGRSRPAAVRSLTRCLDYLRPGGTHYFFLALRCLFLAFPFVLAL